MHLLGTHIRVIYTYWVYIHGLHTRIGYAYPGYIHLLGIHIWVTYTYWVYISGLRMGHIYLLGMYVCVTHTYWVSPHSAPVSSRAWSRSPGLGKSPSTALCLFLDRSKLTLCWNFCSRPIKYFGRKNRGKRLRSFIIRLSSCPGRNWPPPTRKVGMNLRARGQCALASEYVNARAHVC